MLTPNNPRSQRDFCWSEVVSDGDGEDDHEDLNDGELSPLAVAPLNAAPGSATPSRSEDEGAPGPRRLNSNNSNSTPTKPFLEQDRRSSRRASVPIDISASRDGYVTIKKQTRDMQQILLAIKRSEDRNQCLLQALELRQKDASLHVESHLRDAITSGFINERMRGMRHNIKI